MYYVYMDYEWITEYGTREFANQGSWVEFDTADEAKAAFDNADRNKIRNYNLERSGKHNLKLFCEWGTEVDGELVYRDRREVLIGGA